MAFSDVPSWPIRGLMKRRDQRASTSEDFGRRLRQLRHDIGMSRAQLARASGLSRWKLARFERERASISEVDLSALAETIGVEVGVLRGPGHNLSVAAGPLSNGAAGELRGEAALDALLREYLAMVVELRDSHQGMPTILRQDDLTELARTLGGTPQAIEARLRELLGTDAQGACALRTTILPSQGVSHAGRGA